MLLQKKTKINSQYKKIRYPIALLVILILLNISARYFVNINWNINMISILKTIEIIFIAAIAWLALQLVSHGKGILLKKYDIHAKDNLKARKVLTQFSVIQKIINFIIILIALSLILLKFDGIRKVGISLLASAGIAGVILGFAAQKMLSTIIAGLQIAFTQPIRLDDVVIVENEWGWIEEITLTFVAVRLWDKRRLIVPTTYFIEKPFQNWTKTTSEILGTVFIYTDYTVPIDSLRAQLKKIVETDKYWDGKVQVLQVTDATEKTIQLRALVSARNSPDAWELRVNVREKLIRFLQENHPECLPKTRININEQKS